MVLPPQICKNAREEADVGHTQRDQRVNLLSAGEKLKNHCAHCYYYVKLECSDLIKDGTEV